MFVNRFEVVYWMSQSLSRQAEANRYPQNAPCQLYIFTTPTSPFYLSLRASRSDSRRQRMSSSRTVFLHVSQEPCINVKVGGSVESCRMRCSNVPGPLTLRMMLRVVSSINSTRTCVTPPREPVFISTSLPRRMATERIDAGSVECCDVPVRPRTRVTFTSLTGTFDESIIAVVICVIGDLDQESRRWIATAVVVRRCRRRRNGHKSRLLFTHTNMAGQGLEPHRHWRGAQRDRW